MSEIFLVVTVGRGYVIGIFSGKAGVPLNTLQCTGQSPHRRIIWPKMSIVPGMRNSALGKVIHFILWELLALGLCSYVSLDKKTHSL